MRAEARVGQEKREARAEEAREQDFTPEPALVHGPAVFATSLLSAEGLLPIRGKSWLPASSSSMTTR